MLAKVYFSIYFSFPWVGHSFDPKVKSEKRGFRTTRLVQFNKYHDTHGAAKDKGTEPCMLEDDSDGKGADLLKSKGNSRLSISKRNSFEGTEG